MHIWNLLCDLHKGVSAKELILGSVIVFASGPIWSMDLLSAYELAKNNDSVILESRALAAAGRERLPQAKARLLPSVSFSANRLNNNLTQTSPNFFGQEQTLESNYWSSNQTVSVRQPLFRASELAQYRQAKTDLDSVEATLAQDEQTLAVRVSTAYLTALFSFDGLDLLLRQKDTYLAQLDAARKSFAKGLGTRTEIDEAQARIDMNMAQEFEARQNVDYTLQQLSILVNQPVDGSKLSRLNVSLFGVMTWPSSRLEDWISRAEANNPQMIALRAQLESARGDVQKARSGHLPTLDAVAQWTNSKSENITSIQTRNTNSVFGVQLNIPLFSGGATNSAIRQALASVDKAENALESGRRDLGIRVRKEYRNITESMPKLKAIEQAVHSANQMVTSNRKSFAVGLRTSIDILNAEQQLSVAKRDLAQARYMFLISKIRLLALVGEADIAAIQSVNELFL